MSLVEAIILGFIQGLTEFLPVSSSGHLALIKNFFNINTETGILYDIMLHFATLLAVFIVYRKDLCAMIAEFFRMLGDICYNVFHKDKRTVISNSYRKFDLLIIITTIPTGILGVIFDDLVEKLEMTLLAPGIFLVLTAVILFVSDRVKPGDGTPKKTSFGKAIIIGIAQGIATMPGLSRSGTSITACLLCGMNRPFAVKYAFIMSIPAILGAMVLKIPDLFSEGISGGAMINYGAGMLVAFIVGYICIKAMLTICKKRKFSYFGFYCLFVGCLAIGAFIFNTMA